MAVIISIHHQDTENFCSRVLFNNNPIADYINQVGDFCIFHPYKTMTRGN